MVLTILLPLVIAAVLFFARMVTRSIQQPIDKLAEACGRIFYEDFSPVEDAGACDEMHRLIEAFNVMANHIQTLIEEVYKRNLTLAQTEMQLVRSQINPPFRVQHAGNDPRRGLPPRAIRHRRYDDPAGQDPALRHFPSG